MLTLNEMAAELPPVLVYTYTYFPAETTEGPQRSDASEARTRGPSVSSQTLYH